MLKMQMYEVRWKKWRSKAGKTITWDVMKRVKASNPLSACKKAFRVSYSHWESGRSSGLNARVYLKGKLVQHCHIVDNG